MRRLLAVVLLALAAGSAGCQRPTHEECKALCGRYSELHFWAQFERDAAGLSAADRATLEAERKEAWAAQLAEPTNRRRDNCVMECRKGGSRTQATCVAAAKTAAEAAACMQDG